MPQVTRELFQAWTRSFEEDEGDVHVYRPASYQFPGSDDPAMAWSSARTEP